MRKHTIGWSSLFLCLAVATSACGGDDEGDVDATDHPDAAVSIDSAVVADAVVPDAAPPDAVYCPAPAFGAIGGPCVADNDCGNPASGFFCVDEGEDWPAAGFCTRMNCETPADCGAGAFCAHLLGGGGGGPPEYMCLPECCDLDVCPTGTLCQDRIMGMLELDGSACLPGTAEGVDGDACEGPQDCNVNSACQTGLDAPGGMCITFGCEIDNDATCAGGTCVPAGDSGFNICLATCTDGGGECRESEGYRCQPIGFFGVCSHARVGDPCTESADCGITPWMCRTGDPSGYCTVESCTVGDPDSCTDDSFCYDATAGNDYCITPCPTPGAQTGCRSGYLCTTTAQGNGCLPNPG